MVSYVRYTIPNNLDEHPPLNNVRYVCYTQDSIEGAQWFVCEECHIATI